VEIQACLSWRPSFSIAECFWTWGHMLLSSTLQILPYLQKRKRGEKWYEFTAIILVREKTYLSFSLRFVVDGVVWVWTKGKAARLWVPAHIQERLYGIVAIGEKAW